MFALFKPFSHKPLATYALLRLTRRPSGEVGSRDRAKEYRRWHRHLAGHANTRPRDPLVAGVNVCKEPAVRARQCCHNRHSVATILSAPRCALFTFHFITLFFVLSFVYFHFPFSFVAYSTDLIVVITSCRATRHRLCSISYISKAVTSRITSQFSPIDTIRTKSLRAATSSDNARNRSSSHFLITNFPFWFIPFPFELASHRSCLERSELLTHWSPPRGDWFE